MGERAEIVELVGRSTESWEDAVQNALETADETVDHVSGLEVQSETSDGEDGEIERYEVTIEASFVLEDG